MWYKQWGSGELDSGFILMMIAFEMGFIIAQQLMGFNKSVLDILLV